MTGALKRRPEDKNTRTACHVVNSMFVCLFSCADPPPGVLVVTPGSSLVLTCSGDVKVNGAKVILAGSSNNKNKPASVKTSATKRIPSSRTVTSSLQNTVSEKNLRSGPGGNRDPQSTGGRTVSPTPISKTAGDSDWEEEEEEEKKDAHEDEERLKVTRDVRHQRKWSKLPGQDGEASWEEIRATGQEDVLSLDSVMKTDSGKYVCSSRGEEIFAVELIVAGELSVRGRGYRWALLHFFYLVIISLTRRGVSAVIKCEVLGVWAEFWLD